MGSSPSKPSKPSKTTPSKTHKPKPKQKPSKSTISYPTPQHSTTLSYPHLEPLPFHPHPHHPTPSPSFRPTAEHDLAARVAHFQKPHPAHPPPPTTRKQPAPAPLQSNPRPKKPVAATLNPNSNFKMQPLNEIGASKPISKPHAKNNATYGLYPAPQIGAAVGGALKPGSRFGGTKQDRHGEWWVLVLADGRWYRSRDAGVKAPGW